MYAHKKKENKPFAPTLPGLSVSLIFFALVAFWLLPPDSVILEGHVNLFTITFGFTFARLVVRSFCLFCFSSFLIQNYFFLFTEQGHPRLRDKGELSLFFRSVFAARLRRHQHQRKVSLRQVRSVSSQRFANLLLTMNFLVHSEPWVDEVTFVTGCLVFNVAAYLGWAYLIIKKFCAHLKIKAFSIPPAKRQ